MQFCGVVAVCLQVENPGLSVNVLVWLPAIELHADPFPWGLPDLGSHFPNFTPVVQFGVVTHLLVLVLQLFPFPHPPQLTCPALPSETVPQ